MKKTLQVWATGMLVIGLAFVVDRLWHKPATEHPRRLLIIASESPQPVVDQSPAAVDPGDVVKTPAPVLKSDALSERQAALKLILEDFRAEQKRVSKLGQSVDHELTQATAKLFIQLSEDRSPDSVAKLLAEMADEPAAKVLAEIGLTHSELAESLTMKLAALKP